MEFRNVFGIFQFRPGLISTFLISPRARDSHDRNNVYSPHFLVAQQELIEWCDVPEDDERYPIDEAAEAAISLRGIFESLADAFRHYLEATDPEKKAVQAEQKQASKKAKDAQALQLVRLAQGVEGVYIPVTGAAGKTARGGSRKRQRNSVCNANADIDLTAETGDDDDSRPKLTARQHADLDSIDVEFMKLPSAPPPGGKMLPWGRLDCKRLSLEEEKIYFEHSQRMFGYWMRDALYMSNAGVTEDIEETQEDREDRLRFVTERELDLYTCVDESVSWPCQMLEGDETVENLQQKRQGGVHEAATSFHDKTASECETIFYESVNALVGIASRLRIEDYQKENEAHPHRILVKQTKSSSNHAKPDEKSEASESVGRSNTSRNMDKMLNFFENMAPKMEQLADKQESQHKASMDELGKKIDDALTKQNRVLEKMFEGQQQQTAALLGVLESLKQKN